MYEVDIFIRLGDKADIKITILIKNTFLLILIFC